MRNAVAIALLTLLWPAASLDGQRVTETMEVTLVEVPVNVMRNGVPVRDLQAGNFEIYDQGQKREITNFEMIDFSKRAAAAAPAAEMSRSSRRKFLILFDMGNSSVSSLLRAREAALTFVSAQLLPSDLVSVATISAREGFRLLSGFTTDRQLARLAIETLGAPKFYSVNDPLLLTASQLEKEAEALARSRGGGGRVDPVEELKDMALALRKTANQAQKQTIVRQLDQYAGLGQVLDRVSGRKQVILLSEGFDPKMLQGRELGTTTERLDEQTAIESGEVWKVDSDNRFGDSGVMNELRRMTDVLRRSDVILHAIDIKGLRVAGESDILNPRSQESLHLLTRDTGGTVFKNANDLSGEFERMMKAQEVTYVLGFSAPATTPGKFHEIKVRLVDVPDARVTHRIGYYEPSAATNDLGRTLSAGEIIFNSIPTDEIRLRGMAAAIPSKSGTAHVPVVLEVDGQSLIQGQTSGKLGASAYIYAFDDQDIIRDFAYQRLDLDLNKLRGTLEKNGVKLYQTMRLGPGDYSLRVLLRSADGKRSGFQSIRLHVPGAGESYVMPPLLFDDPSGWVMIKAPDRDSSFEYPFQVGSDTFVPALRPTLSDGKTYTLAVFAYDMPGNLNVQASIDDKSTSRPVPMAFLGRAPAAAGAVKLVYELKTPKLANGEYALALLVRGAGTGTENRVSIPFQVQ